ncbi:MAG: hypothetical protein ACR2PX_27790 [Endozoicomonas sp.]|uniref:hypothetical protein n=1 Tax=Endozoicomonas sp. TaxID=1892382 RepID=UPI003D9B0032
MYWRVLFVVGSLMSGVLQANALAVFSESDVILGTGSSGENQSARMESQAYYNERFFSKKRKLGVCISGGGSRSMALARGQMAVLREYGIEEQIADLSLVSGGAWFGVSYYSSQLEDAQILGELVSNPEDLTLDAGQGGLAPSSSNRDSGEEVDSGVRSILKSNLHVMTNASLSHAHQYFSNLPRFIVSFVAGTISRRFDGSHVWSDFLNHSLNGWFNLFLSNEFFVRKRADMNIVINTLLKNGENYYPFEILPDGVRVRSFVDGFQARHMKHSEFGLVQMFWV